MPYSTKKKIDPLTSFRFWVEIGGIEAAYASEVTGLQIETETETYEEGGVNDFVYHFPKRTKYQNITLKRGITSRDEIWKWYKNVVSGYFERKSGAIILMDDKGDDVWRWNFYGAYPVKWVGPDLKADSNTVAFESIEFVHQGIWKDSKNGP